VKRVWPWILGAALGSFAAGVTVGWVAPSIVAAGGAPATPDDAYVADMVAKYDLRAEQARGLRLVLQAAREEEFAVLKSAEVGQLPPSINARLLQVRAQLEKRVRKLLDATQLERYEQASRPKNLR